MRASASSAGREAYAKPRSSERTRNLRLNASSSIVTSSPHPESSTRGPKERARQGGVCQPARRVEATRRSSGDLDHLLTHGVDDGLHPRVQVQLLEDVPDVVLDGVLRDVELLGDVAVVEPLGNQLQDLHLAVGEPRRRNLRAV